MSLPRRLAAALLALPALLISSDLRALPRASATPTALDMASAALMMSGQDGGALPIAADLERHAGELRLRLEVAGDALQPATADGAAADGGRAPNGDERDAGEQDLDDQDAGGPVAQVVVYILDELEVLAAASFDVTVDAGELAGKPTASPLAGLRLRLALAIAPERLEAHPRARVRILVRAGEQLALRSLALPHSRPAPSDPPTSDPTPDAGLSHWLTVGPRELSAGARLLEPTAAIGNWLPSDAGAGRAFGAFPGESARATMPQPREVRRVVEKLRRDVLEAVAGAASTRDLALRLSEIESGLIASFGPPALALLSELERDLNKSIERRLRRLDREIQGRESQEREGPGRGNRGIFAWAFSLHRLHQEHSRNRRQALASRAQAAAVQVARSGADAGLERAAGRLLALIAHDQQRGGRLGLASRLFDQARSWAPEDPMVLWGLALNRERIGNSRAAIDGFESLARSPHGLRHEANLRLAVELRRGDQTEAAQRQIEELLQDTEADAWIRQLALHEQVRLHLRAGHARAALETSSRGLESFPHDFHLAVARARALDLLGERAESRRQLELLSAKADPSKTNGSPRTRFNDWPMATYDALEAELQALADQQLPALRRAAARMLERSGGGR